MKQIKIGSKVSEFFGWYSIVEEIIENFENMTLIRVTQDDGFTSYLIMYFENEDWLERYSSSDIEAINLLWNTLKNNRS